MTLQMHESLTFELQFMVWPLRSACYFMSLELFLWLYFQWFKACQSKVPKYILEGNVCMSMYRLVVKIFAIFVA